MDADESRRGSRSLPEETAHGWTAPERDDLSRILALSDGVFAFAMTLLVLNLTGLSFLNCGTAALPCSASVLDAGLADNISVFVGSAIVSFVVALWGTNHHRIFRFIERHDSTLVRYNIIRLIFIAATPFALEVFNRFSDTTTGVVLFAAVSGFTGLMLGAVWWHALGPAGLVSPKFPQVERHIARRRSMFIPLVFFASVPVAFVAPSIAAYLWAIAFPVGLLMRHYGPA